MVTGNGIRCIRKWHKLWLDVTIKINRAFDKFNKKNKTSGYAKLISRVKKQLNRPTLYVRVFHPGSCALFPSLYFGYLPILKFLIKKIKSLKTVRLWLSISWQSVNYNINKWNTTKNDKNAIVRKHFGQPSYFRISALSGYYMFNMPLDLNFVNLFKNNLFLYNRYSFYILGNV